MFAGSRNQRAAIKVKLFGKNISANVRDDALSHEINCVTYCLYILNLKGHNNCICGSKGAAILLNFAELV